MPVNMVTPDTLVIKTSNSSSEHISDLIKKFSEMTLAVIMANIGALQNPAPMVTPTAPGAAVAVSLENRPARPPRCFWCDSTEHISRSCPELGLQEGLVRNEKGHVVNASTGLKLPTMYGRGGMRILIHTRCLTMSTMTTANSTNVVECRFLRLVQTSLLVCPLDLARVHFVHACGL